MITLFFSFAAGALSTLSPCVLPIVPIIMSSALQTARLGPAALLSGVVLSYTVVGTVLAMFGTSLGVDTIHVRMASAVLMVLLGAALLVPAMQRAFVRFATPLTNSANGKLAEFRGDSVLGQGLLGVMLGLVWSPCVGPTLGAAITMAAGGQSAGKALLTMFAFGVGAAIPMGVLAYGSRSAMGQRRQSMAAVGRRGKQVMGWGLLVVGGLVLTGGDKWLETVLTSHMPMWLMDLTTRY